MITACQSILLVNGSLSQVVQEFAGHDVFVVNQDTNVDTLKDFVNSSTHCFFAHGGGKVVVLDFVHDLIKQKSMSDFIKQMLCTKQQHTHRIVATTTSAGLKKLKAFKFQQVMDCGDHSSDWKVQIVHEAADGKRIDEVLGCEPLPVALMLYENRKYDKFLCGCQEPLSSYMVAVARAEKNTDTAALEVMCYVACAYVVNVQGLERCVVEQLPVRCMQRYTNLKKMTSLICNHNF